LRVHPILMGTGEVCVCVCGGGGGAEWYLLSLTLVKWPFKIHKPSYAHSNPLDSVLLSKSLVCTLSATLVCFVLSSQPSCAGCLLSK
jgi:hypothetical protein